MVGVVVVVYLSIYLSTYLSIHLYLSVYLQSASLKRSYSARPPQILNLTTSKTQQFCETSSIFWQRQKRSNSARLPLLSKLRKSKRKQLWETSFNSGKLRAELTASCQCVLRFFHFLSKVLRLPRKVMPGRTKCCTCHAKSSAQNLRSDSRKCNPSQEISALTS